MQRFFAFEESRKVQVSSPVAKNALFAWVYIAVLKVLIVSPVGIVRINKPRKV